MDHAKEPSRAESLTQTAANGDPEVHGAAPDLSHAEERKAAERTAIPAAVVLEAVRAEGLYKLHRPALALAWSALAAGLSMGFSLVGQGLFFAFLPATPWRPLVASLGYSLGFLIVVLGRQQLFTENTLTAMVPLLAQPSFAMFGKVLRLWCVVLACNVLGAFLFVRLVMWPGLFSSQITAAFVEIGLAGMHGSFGLVVLRDIFAGWLIALMVWLLPAAEAGRVQIIIILTYIVALGQFAHIIAGSIDGLYLVNIRALSWTSFAGGFFLPTLLGNCIGGVSLVALLNYAQVAAQTQKHTNG